MASYLYRNSPVPTSEKKFTFSTWLKMSDSQTAADNGIVEWYKSSSERYQILIDSSTRQLRLYAKEANTVKADIYTDMVFRDTNAWYHIVIHSDTTQSSASDRFKLWVNGVAQTFSAYSFNYAQNANVNVFDGSSTRLNLGTRGEAYATWLNGYLADTYYIDGSLIAHTEFGETDSTSGIWKPNTTPTISSFGNAGVHLKYENSGTIGLDSSGNTNNFTASGTINQAVDNPSNNFCTLNAVQRSRLNTNNSGDYLINGNNTFDTSSSNGIKAIVNGTVGVQSGKYYWESKIITNTKMQVGISTGLEQKFPQPYYDETEYSAMTLNLNGTLTGRYTGSTYDEYGTGTSNTANDILGFALDMDNKALYVHKNGTYLSNGSNVGVPTSGSSRTGSLIEGLAGSRDNYFPTGEFMFPVVMDLSTSGVAKLEFNFGNGFFGTTAVSSAGTNASGFGVFEYDVPTGYTALCTKGLNE